VIALELFAPLVANMRPGLSISRVIQPNQAGLLTT
jgi:hypothetical protein